MSPSRRLNQRRTESGMNRIVEEILRKRGVEDVERFLDPRLADLASAASLPGMDRAAEIVYAAIRAKSPIVVFGDYDCDGISATAILTRTIRLLGGVVSPFLPRRLEEGYGMTDASVGRMLAEHPEVKLVVTVDNGINSIEQVAALSARGIETVVTDHHLPGEELPAAAAVVNPKVAANDGLDALCGAGVAFFLAQALVQLAKRDGVIDGKATLSPPLLVLAGLATVTDIMPLDNLQNRILVSTALARFSQFATVGLKELYQHAATKTPVRFTSKDFGFLLGPRINAAGRMTSGTEALELLLCDEGERERARELARTVDGYNRDRKEVEQQMADAAFAQVVEGAAAQVIDLPDGHIGVAGIVASRVLEKLGAAAAVPVCVVVDGHGSARAPKGYNVRDALEASSEALDRFGGHAAAAGFSVKSGMLEEFRKLIAAACARQAVSAPACETIEERADAVVEPEDITLELARDVRRMEPFGEGNPEPLFAIRGVRFADGGVRPLGPEGRHLSLAFAGGCPRGVWWGHGDQIEALRARGSRPVDALVALEISTYGEEHVELRVVDVVCAD